MLGTAARGIEVGDAGWIGTAPAAVIACQRPKIAGLGGAAAGIEHRGSGLVHEQLARGLQLLGETVEDRPQVERRLAHPVGEDGAAQADPGPGVDLRLAVERQVVGVLRDQHMGKQRLGGQGTLDQVGGCRGLGHGAGAAAAGVLRPDGHDHPEPGGGDVEPFAAIFPDPHHGPAAAGAKRALGLENALDPWQLLRQPAKMAPGRGSLRARPRPRHAGGGLGRLDLRHGSLEVLEGELPLVHAQLLRLPAVQRLPELPHQMLEPTVLLGECFDLLLERAPCRALGFDEGTQLGRQGGEVDRGKSGHGCEHTGHRGIGGALAPGVSHSAAVGRRTRRGPCTRCHSSPSNSASNCARDSRMIPSRIAGQANLPCSSLL